MKGTDFGFHILLINQLSFLDTFVLLPERSCDLNSVCVHSTAYLMYGGSVSHVLCLEKSTKINGRERKNIKRKKKKSKWGRICTRYNHFCLNGLRPV